MDSGVRRYNELKEKSAWPCALCLESFILFAFSSTKASINPPKAYTDPLEQEKIQDEKKKLKREE